MNIDASFFDFVLKFVLPFGSALALVTLLVYQLSKSHHASAVQPWNGSGTGDRRETPTAVSLAVLTALLASNIAAPG